MYITCTHLYIHTSFSTWIGLLLFEGFCDAPFIVIVAAGMGVVRAHPHPILNIHALDGASFQVGLLVATHVAFLEVEGGHL